MIRSRILLRALRRVIPESAARMRRRLLWASVLRGMIWQGANASVSGHDRDGIDPALLPHFEQDLVNQIKRGETCSLTEGTRSSMTSADYAAPYQAGAIIPIRSYWRYPETRQEQSPGR